MAYDRKQDGDDAPATVDGHHRLQFDEGQAVADRLEDLDDEDDRESFDEVFSEFDERFASE